MMRGFAEDTIFLPL